MPRPDARRRGQQRPRLEPLEARELLTTYATAGPPEWMGLRAGYTQGARVVPPDTDVAAPADFDGDGKAEPALYRVSTATWYVLNPDGSTSAQQMGQPYVSLPVVGDYDGDGKADQVIFNLATATWTGHLSGGGDLSVPFGASDLTDIPVPGDYDGDGKADIALYRPAAGLWLFDFSTGGTGVWTFGRPDLDVPVPGDYDGDGRTDLALFQPDTAIWQVMRTRLGPEAVQHGQAGRDAPMPADFDGDGKTDIAVFRPDTDEWLILRSGSTPTLIQHGAGGYDVPAPADFDGDGKADVAVVRPESPYWLVLQSAGRPTARTLDPAVVPVPYMNNNWMRQHVLNEDRAARQPVDLAFFGDSITYYLGDDGRTDTGSASWAALTSGRSAANYGIPSDTTQGLLWRIEHGEMPGHPKVAVVAIGTNNLGPDLAQSPEETARGVAAIVRAIRTESPGTKVLLMGVFPRGADAGDPLRAEVRRTNALLAPLADGEDVVFLDIGGRFLRPDGSISTDILRDGLHPTAAGYAIWADAIKGTLDRMLA
jgi:lysophospholipase L1-like esterase